MLEKCKASLKHYTEKETCASFANCIYNKILYLACVASVSVGFGSKELQRENGALAPFSARAKHQKSRSLLPNPRETLATQAILYRGWFSASLFVT